VVKTFAEPVTRKRGGYRLTSRVGRLSLGRERHRTSLHPLSTVNWNVDRSDRHPRDGVAAEAR